ncbi:hypothetical protein KBC75_05510 [Candidatus Shapirobacteria bacterium]|nr:hypothetical protein [Candidatus Shapirobacteria bacterium]
MPTIIFIATLIYAYFYGKKILDTGVDGELTKSEKIQVIAMMLINTPAAMVFYDYWWRQKLPIKAKQSNKYLWNMVKVYLWFVGLGIATVITLVTISRFFGTNRFDLPLT